MLKTQFKLAWLWRTAALLALAAIALPAAAQKIYRDGNYWVEETTGFMTTSRMVKISAEMGNINVNGADQPNITWMLKKRVRASSEARARELFTGMKIVAGNQGEWAMLTTKIVDDLGRGFNAELNVTVPRNTDTVRVRTNGGNLGFNGLQGKTIGETMGGNVSLADLGGPISIHTMGGNIDLRNAGNDATLQTAGGNVNVESVEGMLVVHSYGGNITIGRAGKGAMIETAGGSIDLRQCGGDLKAATAGGNIEIVDVVGSATMKTAGGSIKLRSAKGPVAAITAGGDIKLLSLTHGARAETAAGRISVEFTDTKTFTDSTLETSVGDVIVYLAPNLPVTISAAVHMAHGNEIRSDFPDLKIYSEGSQWGPRDIFAEGKLNGGGPVLKIRTTSGNIELRRTSK